MHKISGEGEVNSGGNESQTIINFAVVSPNLPIKKQINMETGDSQIKQADLEKHKLYII